MVIGITSVGTATSIGLIKNIRKYNSNIKIVGTDINMYGYTAGSMLVDCFYQVPLATDVSYIDKIINIIEEENIDCFIPINDVEIEVFAKNRLLWIDKCRSLIPAYDDILLIRDKLKSTLAVMQLGVECPPMIDSQYRGKTIIRDRVGVGSKGIKVVNKGTGDIPLTDEQFAQQFVMGDEYTIDMLCDVDGLPIYIVPRRRIEIKAGVATKVEIVYNTKLISCVKLLANRMKLPGFSNIQFICNEEHNWFIEINPRFGGCSSATLLAAPEAFDSFMKILTDEKLEEKCYQEVNPNVKWGSIVTRYYEELLYEKKN